MSENNGIDLGDIRSSPQKPLDTLREQVHRVSEHVGVSITPPIHKEQMLGMSWEELQNNHLDRALVYEAWLRHFAERKRSGESGAAAEFSTDDILPKAELLQMNLEANISRWEQIQQQYTEEELWENMELQEWQMGVYKKVAEFMDQKLHAKYGDPEGYIQLPTGTGKTVIFSELAVTSGLKTLIVVPNVLLLEQTVDKLKKQALKRGVMDLDVGTFYGEGEKRIGRDVTVAVYNSFATDLTGDASQQNHEVSQDELSKLQAGRFGLVILDEAHRCLSERRMRAIDKIDGALKIGFSATPKFSGEKQVAHFLNQEIFKMTIREAVEQNLLASPEPYIVKTSVNLDGVGTSKKNGFEDYNESELATRVNILQRNEAAVRLYVESDDIRGKTAVAYCVGVKHATDLAQLYRDSGVPAEVISGQTPRKERERILRQYKEGEIKVLCNADLLIEGFDEPRASVCFNLRPTKSIVVAEQRAGRVLRKDKENPDKYALIIDFIDDVDDDKKNQPIVFEDIYNGDAARLDRERQLRVGFRNTQLGQVVSLEDSDGEEGVEVGVYRSVVESQKFISTAKEKDAATTSPWTTEFDLRTQFGLNNDRLWNEYIMQSRIHLHPEWRRERIGIDGQTIVEYHIQAIEEAVLMNILSLFEEINISEIQNNKINLPMFYLYFHEQVSNEKNSPKIKQFLLHCANVIQKKREFSKEEISNFIKTLDSTSFFRGFRDYQTKFSIMMGKEQNKGTYIKNAKHAVVQLLDMAPVFAA